MTEPLRHRPYALPKTLRVLITGCASGIGLAQTRLFLEAGHRVVGIDYQSTSALEALMQAYPDTFSYIDCDITQQEATIDAVQRAVEWLAGMDVLCNTAGQLDDYQTIDSMTCDAFDYYLNVNLKSHFTVTKTALPALLENPTSRIINMASIASLTAGGGGIAYTAAKHALAGFTKQLAYDYSDRGLRVNALAPGAIDTPMNQADFTNDNGKMAQWVAEQTPVKRWAQPEEVAEWTLFLASDASDYLQGAIIPLDGGWLIR